MAPAFERSVRAAHQSQQPRPESKRSSRKHLMNVSVRQMGKQREAKRNVNARYTDSQNNVNEFARQLDSGSDSTQIKFYERTSTSAQPFFKEIVPEGLASPSEQSQQPKPVPNNGHVTTIADQNHQTSPQGFAM